MYGEFEGGIKLTDEEKHKIKFYEKHFGALLKGILNWIT